MSTAGSVRSSGTSPYTPDAQGAGEGPSKTRRRTRVFRWQGIIPIALVAALFALGWTLLADRVARGTIAEAGTKALGAQLDIDELTIHTLSTTLEMRGVALADPFDSTRNLFEIGRFVVGLEAKPLLQKKLVIRELTIANVRTGTPRDVPARPVSGGGFAPRALAEVRRFAGQFAVPLLSLTPIDTLKALVLDPTQLSTVKGALALAQGTDSTRTAIEQGVAGLRLQETVDSSAALVTRLQGTNVRALGIPGARAAVQDVRRAIARVDSARGRVDRLVNDTRRSLDSLQSGVANLDDLRRADYAFARGLLQLPTFNAPDIGSALFGRVTIDRFEQAVYWATLARQYAPPGLLPKESEGPERVRSAGTTVHFVTPESYPRFLLRDARINVTVGDSGAAYALVARDVTSEPSILGRPTQFALRRSARGGFVDSLRVNGTMDHLGSTPKEILNAYAAGVALPKFQVPSLPFTIDPGRGTSELAFALSGDQITGRWHVRSAQLRWITDSARARPLNSTESLIARVLTGIGDLELTADVSGTLTAPRLMVRSNLDRQIADRLRAVMGEEIAAAERKVRAQVDRIVEQRAAPVRARVAELRSESERRLADARARLDEEKRKLEERLKALGIAALGV